MPRYSRNYDYGLRGPREMGPRGGGFRARGYDIGYDERANPRDRPARVVARYNLDYVYGGRGDRYARDYNYPRNYHMYTGERMDRMGDERFYRHPYMTVGGTRTMRGASYPTGYDYPNYGPDYGGRYPDEL